MNKRLPTIISTAVVGASILAVSLAGGHKLQSTSSSDTFTAQPCPASSTMSTSQPFNKHPAPKDLVIPTITRNLNHTFTQKIGNVVYDGTWKVDSKGSLILTYNDGSILSIHNRGEGNSYNNEQGWTINFSWEICKHGTFIKKYDNGERREFKSDGTMILTFSNNDCEETKPDDTVIYIWEDGERRETKPNGTVIWTSSEGRTTIEALYDHSAIRRLSDNSVTNGTWVLDDSIRARIITWDDDEEFRLYLD